MPGVWTFGGVGRNECGKGASGLNCSGFNWDRSKATMEDEQKK